MVSNDKRKHSGNKEFSFALHMSLTIAEIGSLSQVRVFVLLIHVVLEALFSVTSYSS